MNSNFKKLYLSRVFRIIEKYKLIVPGDRIFVALSGGKDSCACLWAINQYVNEKNMDVDVIGFHLNFGLNHSNLVENVIRKQTQIVGCKLRVANVKDFGIDMKKLDTTKRPICSYCGNIKRYLMNKLPREEGATKLATGHHMDDFLVFFFKNMLTRNYTWITKFRPLLPGKENVLTKIRPLYEVGGLENEKICKLENLPYLQKDVCPHSILGKKADPKLKKWYELLYNIESWQKDFRLLMIRSIRKILKYLPKEKEIYKRCSICGEPTNQEVCGFCKIKQALKSKDE